MLNCEPDDSEVIAATLGCQLAELPLTYLGIPLTLRRPTRAQMQPLVSKTAAKLPTWKSRLMDRSGRLVLVKSVLAAIPLHQILVLQPPKCILKLLEKIQRGFLWDGRAEANGGHCHVNWQAVCRPLSLGGLGVQDMERAGLALRMRWLWYNRTDQVRAWSGLELQFSRQEQSLFFASTHMIVGDGHLGRFWEDRWIAGRSVSQIAPELYACIPKRRRKATSIRDGLLDHSWARDIHGVLGLQELGQYLMLWTRVEATVLTDQPDQIVWRWSTNGVYSAKSCYRSTFQGSRACPAWKLLWKTWAPPRVKFFHWLANKDRCWTAERLRRRGLQHHPRCLLCDQEAESMHHLTLACPFSRQVWYDTLSWLRLACRPLTTSLPSTIGGSLRDITHPSQCEKALQPPRCLCPG
jgi:hypothetical protein